MVQLLPAPTQLVYLLLLAIFIAQAIGVAVMPETALRKHGALASLRPHFKLPVAVRRPLLIATPAMVAAWAFVGFYGSLGPALVRHLVGSTAPILGGLALFVLAASAVVATIVLHARDRQTQLTIGTTLLVAGVTTTLVAIAGGSPITLFAGTMIAGAGFGAAFQGAIASVVSLAAPTERAGVLSIVYVIGYLSFGLPAVITGAVVASTHDVIAAAKGYGLVVVALASLALIGSRWRQRVAVTAFET
jgi:hypothetical protein